MCGIKQTKNFEKEIQLIITKQVMWILLELLDGRGGGDAPFPNSVLISCLVIKGGLKPRV